MQYQPQNTNSGNPLANLVTSLVSAAITRAAPNYLPLTRQANSETISTGNMAIPNGPYRN